MLVVVAGAAVFLSISSPASSVEVVSGPIFFDSDQAFRWATAMNQIYDERTLGSEDAAGVIDWFVEKLPEPDLAKIDEFEARIGDRAVTLRNVAVVLQGTSREAVLIAAPRDMPTVVKVEPLAYASGTAMLLELIQVFSARPHQKTLIFLSTEDGTTGGLGIDRFLDTSPLADNVSTILSFQELGRERTKALTAGVTASQNTTPGWYVRLVGQVLGGAGLLLDVPGLLSQAADHALSLSRGDQVAGLSRGIASLQLTDKGSGNPTATGLAKQGAAMERLVLSLDTGAEAPPDPGTALLLRSGRYLTNRAITMLAVLMVLPSLAALLIWLFSSQINARAALRHLRNLASFAIPLAFLFLLSYLLARAGLIPLYRFQVPTADGPGTEPRLAPTLILVLLGGAAFVLSRRFLGYFRPKESKAATEMARLCAGFLGLLAGLILILSRSPFLALPCLTAAWAWPLATCFAEPVYTGAFWRHRLTSNAPVLLLGLVAPVALYLYVAEGYGVGWLKAWWFLIVQTVSGAYGVRGPLAMVFIAAAFAVLLGAKRMRVVPIETLEITDELSLLEPPVPRSRRKPRDTSRPPLSPWG
ncbi:MAG: hypothetical protein A2133_11010 [Actinobacteria bacterium RBG_16_64_13]|nr:MAG: hypothetical protein A2133_11010 [Actinobacteria bacterium RBG_16_64_13]